MKSRIFIALLLAVSGCRNSNPVSPIKEQPPTLTVEDVSCTEVWLKISVPGANNETVTIQRDTTVIDTIRLTTADTTIVDANVLPSHTYTYTLAMSGVKSVTAQARTMDTTSHAFTWQSFTFGDGGGSCVLNDVAIINDTLAYAVGEIYIGGTISNCARWNGQRWDTLHIFVTLTYTGSQIVTDQDPLMTILAFNENDIWVVSRAGGVSHWNGTQWMMLSIPFNQGPGACNKMWGTSSSNLYFVGNEGRIIYYNGTSWTQISSGTTLDVRAIWGAQNANTGSLEIYATAGNPYISPDRTILQISGTTAKAISTAGIFSALNGIWFSPEQYYWLAGDGECEKHPTLSASSWNSLLLSGYTTDAVRGNALNDVFMCGAYGEFLHFNGVSWKSYITQTGIDGAYLGLSVSGNTVIAVGYLSSSQAIILMGKR